MEDAFLHCNRSGFTFLDEFRLVTSNGRLTMVKGTLELLVFDTSLPPGSWERFSIAPPHFRYDINLMSCQTWINTDNNGPRGDGSCDGPFTVDPTQSVVVIYIHHNHHPGRPAWTVALVIRAAALVRYMCSTPSGKRIPWGRWGGDVAVVELPGDGIPSIQTFVLGTRVLFLRCNRLGGCHVHVHDFSLWGCRALVRTGGGSRRKRRALPKPEKIWSPREFGDELLEMQTLGDTLVVCSVSVSQPNCTGDLRLH